LLRKIIKRFHTNVFIIFIFLDCSKNLVILEWTIDCLSVDYRIPDFLMVCFRYELYCAHLKVAYLLVVDMTLCLL